MNVLVACEESQEVCKAFRARGHTAFSCDIIPCSGGHPEWHIWRDVLQVINGCTGLDGMIRRWFHTVNGEVHEMPERWDLIIAHPPCTDLAVSGARWFAEKQKDLRQQKACVFFMQMILANCDRIAVENPVGIMSTVYRKPDQIIQPYNFGEPFEKRTCLWLKGLPKLTYTKTVEPPPRQKIKGGKTMPEWYSNAKKKERAQIRARTFPGIAAAMAEQWGAKV